MLLVQEPVGFFVEFVSHLEQVFYRNELSSDLGQLAAMPYVFAEGSHIVRHVVRTAALDGGC